ncbi:MAG: zinc ribbon domain-containing protein [Firmicutes bacterium]|nr:zinc ribbon domain-containing protein [Bacillota bacterium]
MPIYEFTCKQCSHEFSVMVSISEKEQVKCPRCSSAELQQMFNSPFSIGRKSSCSPPSGSGFS